MEINCVLVTGGFDPLHNGHIAYFKAAKSLGNKLIVGINSDKWLIRKKGRAFMLFNERKLIIENLSMVDEVISFNDNDDTACDAIRKLIKKYNIITFANGGDRTNTTTPEYATYGDHPSVEFAFGIGGENKANSSSWILDKWKTQKTQRDWGYWRVLDDKPEKGYKVKELVIYPGKALSNQKHFKRSEQWNVLEGEVKMVTEWDDRTEIAYLTPSSRPYEINKEVWHLPSNPGTENAHILEIQCGEQCVEEDIERR